MHSSQHRGNAHQSVSHVTLRLQPQTGTPTPLTRSRKTLNSERPCSQLGECAGPLRRCSTLEGRTQLIYNPPSRARDGLLSRGRSPSTNSSVSQITRQNNFPNSLSDGALMKKQVDHTPEDSTQSINIRTNPSCKLNKAVCFGSSRFQHNTPFYGRPVTGSVTLATICSEPLQPQAKHHTSLPKFCAQVTKTTVPSRLEYTQGYKTRASTSPSAYSRELHTDPLQPRVIEDKTPLRHTSPSNRRKTVSITEPITVNVTTNHVVPRSEPNRNREKRTRPKSNLEVKNMRNLEKPSFTKHLSTLEKEPIVIKSNGKTCEYPLNTWFVTSQLESYDEPSQEDSIRHSVNFEPSSPENLWPEEQCVEPAPVRPSSYHWPIPKTTPNGLVKSNSCGFTKITSDVELITAVSRITQPQVTQHRNPRSSRALPQNQKSVNRRAPLAPEEIMNNSSADTESSISEQRAATISSKNTQASVKQEKLKVTDLRRTTPRQLKQHKQQSGFETQKTSSITTVDKSITGLSKFGKPGSIEQLGLNKHPGEIASSLLRTASCRIRSTLSKLKRSNSGHSPSRKPQLLAVDNLGNRRSSDPVAVVLEKVTVTADNETQTSRVRTIPATTAHLINVNATPKTVASVNMYSTKSNNQPLEEASPLIPGSSQWSTRLGPPPPLPVSPNRSVPTPRVLPIFQGLPHSPVYGQRDQPTTPPCSYDVTHEWKSPPLGSGFCSLPLGETDNLNLLNDDCVDVGDLGRINYRTGSFMGRYPHPRSQQAGHYLNTHPFLHRNLTQSATPTRLSPSRPLYLSPYQASSSGNTTRSAPSPSLSSVTSTSVPIIPTSSVFQATACQNSTVPDSGRMHGIVSSSPKVDLNSVSFQELDPVLDRLLSDVSSIEHYRSTLRSQAAEQASLTSTPTRSTSVKPVRLMPSSNERIPNDHQPQLTVIGMRSISSGSSDPGSVARMDRRSSTSTLAPPHERLDEQLRQQISDLINLEFAYQHPLLSSPRVEIKDTQEVLAPPPNQPRLSEPSVNIEDDRKSDIIKRISRYHPFRWSSGARTGTKEPRKYENSIRPQPRIRIEKAPSNLVESGSVDQLTRTGKKQHTVPIKPKPITTDESPPSDLHVDSGFWLDSEGAERLSLWQLSTNQLALLRKLSLVQITSLVEKYCGSRSLFSWRLPKSRGTGNTPEPHPNNTHTSTAPNSQNVVLIHAPKLSSEPIDSSRQTQMHHKNSSSTTSNTNGGSSIPQFSAKPEANTTSLERRTCYDGPVFGQSLESWQHRLGYPLPPAILNMMDHIERVGVNAHGIFRRPGRKDRIQSLREEIEKDLHWNNFEDWQPYDVADLLKQFFRELPECLLTDKLSLVLVSVYGSVPTNTQMDLLRWILIGMPDENRMVLQKLLYILNSLVQHTHVTQMGASNLAVCFAPSLFRFASSSSPISASAGLSPRRLRRTKSGPDPKDLADQRTAQHSLATMIVHAPTLFEISTAILRRAHLHPPQLEPRELDLLIPGSDWPTWIQTELGRLSRECTNPKPKGWTALSRDAWKSYQSGSGAGESLEGLEIHFKKTAELATVQSDPQLRTWRCSLIISESSPKKILDQYWSRRTSWDPDIQQVQVVEQISDCVDICLITHAVTFPLPMTKFHVLRGRQNVLVDGGCAMFCESVSLSGSNTLVGPNTAIGHIYEDHVYVRPQPENNGCRVYLLSRMDLRGHTPDWYVKHWGHTLVRRLLNLRRSFDSAQQR